MINFIIPSGKEITRYLNAHPELLGLVLKIVDQLNEKFEEDLEVELKITEDEAQKWLIIYVRCKAYNNDFMEKIKEIRREDFYHKTLSNSKGWLLLTTDFKIMES